MNSQAIISKLPREPLLRRYWGAIRPLRGLSIVAVMA
jgi:hypothetical protein